MRPEFLGGVAVLVLDGEGPPVDAGATGDLLTSAFEASARTVAIAAERLDPAFFELRSGVAGEMVQRMANYRMRLAVVGPLAADALASRSFSAFVREGNRGDGPWFVASLDELGVRLTAMPPEHHGSA